MKQFSKPWSRWLVTLSLLWTSFSAFALANNVDPARLGRGTWIYSLSDATNGLGRNVVKVTDIPGLMTHLKEHDVNFLMVRAGKGTERVMGTNGTPQFTTELIEAAHGAGLKIFATLRCEAEDLPGEIKLAGAFYDEGADGVILEVGDEWESSKRFGEARREKAAEFAKAIKAGHPDHFLAFTSFAFMSRHARLPYREFGLHCDAAMPQAYWKNYDVSPKRMVETIGEEWAKWQAALSAEDQKAVKPVIPVGQGWNPSDEKIVTAREIRQFIAALNYTKAPAGTGPYAGVALRATELHTAQVWDAFRSCTVGDKDTTSEDWLIEEPAAEAAPAVKVDASLVTQIVASGSKVMDKGINPARLGKGTWIYVISDCTNRLGGNAPGVTDLPSLMQHLKKETIDFIAVKAGTGARGFPSTAEPQFNRALVDAAHAAGLKIFGYTRSDGKDVPGEIELAKTIYELNADGFIIDAEVEWESHHLENAEEKAIQLCEGIKKLYPNKFLAHAPLPIISKHASYPYKEFNLYCDAVMPQAYWKSIGVTPRRMMSWMHEEWTVWQKSLTGVYTNAIKPVAPIGQAWNPSEDKIVTAREVMQFVGWLNRDQYQLTKDGYGGVSYWRADLHTAAMWNGIRRANIADRASTPDDVLKDEDGVSVAEATGKPASDNPAEIAPVAAAAKPTPNPDGIVIEPGRAQIEKDNEIILDDTCGNVTFNGAWYPGRRLMGAYGQSYLCANAHQTNATATAVFRPQIPQTGRYDVYVWYSPFANRSAKAPWLVSAEGGNFSKSLDQTKAGGQWELLASNVIFAEGSGGFVSVANDSGESPTRIVIADAVKLVRKN